MTGVRRGRGRRPLPRLIRIDTTQLRRPLAARASGRPPSTWPSKLAEVGLEPHDLRVARPGRANVVARIEGEDPTAAALLIHGHLDVVPADAADWTVAPVLRRDRRTAACGAAARST